MTATTNGKPNPLAAPQGETRNWRDAIIARGKAIVEDAKREKEDALDELAGYLALADGVMKEAEEEAARLIANHARDVRTRTADYTIDTLAAQVEDDQPLDPEFRAPPPTKSQTEKELAGFDPAPLDARKVPPASLPVALARFIPKGQYNRHGAAQATVSVPHVNGVALATANVDDDVFTLTSQGLGDVSDDADDKDKDAPAAATPAVTTQEPAAADAQTITTVLEPSLTTPGDSEPMTQKNPRRMTCPECKVVYENVQGDEPKCGECLMNGPKFVNLVQVKDEPPPKPATTKRGGKNGRRGT